MSADVRASTGGRGEAPRRQPVTGVLVAHVQTWRPYTSCYPAMVGVAGATAAGGRTAPVLVVAALAPLLGWLSGHYIGDYLDRHLDAVAKPQRPIPSGRLSPAAARASGVVCAALSLALLVAANWRTVPVFAAAMAGIVAYSAVLKRSGFSGNVSRGALTALAVVIGAMVAVPWPPWTVLPIALAFLLHDTASNLVGTVRDVDGDLDGGYVSVPARHGVSAAVWLASALYLGGVLTVGLMAEAARFPVAQLVGSATAVLLGCAALVPLHRSADVSRRTALRAHELLVAERLVLAAAVIAGAAGPWPALALLTPALAFSLITQALMRSRHEFPVSPAGGKDAA